VLARSRCQFVKLIADLFAIELGMDALAIIKFKLNLEIATKGCKSTDCCWQRIFFGAIE
jgi:hypothetical protein